MLELILLAADRRQYFADSISNFGFLVGGERMTRGTEEKIGNEGSTLFDFEFAQIKNNNFALAIDL